MSWQACVITLLPEAFPGMLGHALAGRALDEGVWSLCVCVSHFNPFASCKI